MLTSMRLLILFFLFTCHLHTVAGDTFIVSGSHLQPTITVTLTGAQLSKLSTGLQDGANSMLSLHLVTDGKPAATPVYGTYKLEGWQLSFTPLYPLGQALEYEIRYAAPAGIIKHRYCTGQIMANVAARPVQIYPVTDTVPANILSFHIRFSEPMFADPGAYASVSVYTGNGIRIGRVWRQRSYWLDSNRLLLLMIHPGRVKSGIHYMGPIFEQNKVYTLKLEGGLKDRYGRPVQAGITKTFVVGGEDRQLPSIIKIAVKGKDSKTKVSVIFSESMDMGTVTEGIQLFDTGDNNIPCSIRETGTDKAFSIIPSRGWKPGKYTLRFYRNLSDLAGNRLTRPFEITDIEQKIHEPEFIPLSFFVK